MDRLSALVPLGALVLCGAGCDGGKQDLPAQPSGRVNAVMASPKKISLADLCDVAPTPARPFEWPGLTSAPPSASGHLRWLNVWATWCKPCVEELPLLSRTLAAWKQRGHEVALTLLSVDTDAAAADSFIAARPGLPKTLRLSDASGASDWLQRVGLPSGASIPVHIVLDAQDHLLCARAGGISQDDLDRFDHALFR